MSEIKNEPSPPLSPATPDPLGKLHRMSTTAGVGNYDYVAVNVASVWAILFGLASALALLGPYLLAIPVIAFIFAGIAMKQIAKSNGTETGRLLVWGAIFLGVLFAALEGGRILAEQRQDIRDKDAIFALADHLSREIKSGDYDQAYQLFSPEFRFRVNLAQFTSRMQLLRENPYYGTLVSIRSNGYVVFEGGYADQIRLGVSRLEMKFSKQPQPLAQDSTFRRRDGIWFIDNISDMFPAQAQK